MSEEMTTPSNVVNIEEKSLPDDLRKLIGSLEGLAISHNLIHFSIQNAQSIHNALTFLKSLYEQTLNEALKHPDATKSAQLRRVLDARAQEAEILAANREAEVEQASEKAIKLVNEKIEKKEAKRAAKITKKGQK